MMYFNEQICLRFFWKNIIPVTKHKSQSRLCSKMTSLNYLRLNKFTFFKKMLITKQKKYFQIFERPCQNWLSTHEWFLFNLFYWEDSKMSRLVDNIIYQTKNKINEVMTSLLCYFLVNIWTDLPDGWGSEINRPELKYRRFFYQFFPMF